MRILKAAVLATLLTLAGIVVSSAASAAGDPQIVRIDGGGYQCLPGYPARHLGYFADVLEAYGTDDTATSNDAKYSFEVWSEADPADRTKLISETDLGRLGRATVPANLLVDDTTVHWRARLTTSSGASPWSAVCSFDYDGTAPPAPDVTSGNFPEGGSWGPAGVRAQFTFDGADPDVAGFTYTWGSQGVPACDYSGPQGQLVCPDFLHRRGVVLADRPGAPVTVRLNPPGDFQQTLSVQSIDLAGNVSQYVTYQILVPPTGPAATAGNPRCDGTIKVRVRPNDAVPPATAYQYAVDGSTRWSPRIPATSSPATVISVVLGPYFHAVDVRSISTNGFISSSHRLFLQTRHPLVVAGDPYTNTGDPAGGVGVPGTFTVHPAEGDDVSTTGYQYRFNIDPYQDATFDPSDHSGTIQFTPNSPGRHTLNVVEENTDGSRACSAVYRFRVAG